MSSDHRSRAGRPPKGDRTATTLRAPSDHMKLYRAEAQSRGLNLTDYLAEVLAQAHGLEAPSYNRDSTNQPPLLAVS